MKNMERTNTLSPEHPIHRHEPRNRTIDNITEKGERRKPTGADFLWLRHNIRQEASHNRAKIKLSGNAKKRINCSIPFQISTKITNYIRLSPLIMTLRQLFVLL